MFDIKLIRDDAAQVQKRLAAKNVTIDCTEILAKDKIRHDLILQLDQLRNQKNLANDEIGQLLKEKKDPQKRIASMKKIAKEIDALQPKLKDVEAQLHVLLLNIPNVPHESVPVGKADQNKIVRTWGETTPLDFKPKTHIELAESLDIIDFKRASKISGSNFVLYKNAGARLERALYNFMIDLHTHDHGYTEVAPPVLVNRKSMTGTGQLPKMEEDMYRLPEDDLFLIPTAEVPVTNIHADEILKEEDLPVCYTAFTPCFRREAGSYGKDTRGLIRVHQFDKVELVRFCKPKDSYNELELLVNHAEKVFQLLELPYRVVLLASGDLSFAAAKCYDIEVFAPGVNQWLEVSSCSNFEDFQARRANIRFKGKETPQSTWVHTLNGSGVALARTVVAILENYQTSDGTITIPKILQPYMGDRKTISR